MKPFVCYVRNDKIKFSTVGWPVVVSKNRMYVFITKGWRSKKSKVYYHWKPNKNYIKISKPLLIEIDKESISQRELFLIRNIPKINIELIHKSESINKIGNLYVDIYGKPLSEIEILDILNFEFGDKK